MSCTILLPKDIRNKGKQYLLDRGYHLKIGRGRTEEDILADIADCEGLLVCNDPITAKILRHANRLKVIGRHGIGLDNIDIDTANQLGIAVTNAPFANVNSVAEHTIALMLACVKHLIIMDRNLHMGNYECRSQLLGCDLSGKTLGLIGFGRIGQSVGKKAAALGMHIIAYDPFFPKDQAPSNVRLLPSWDDVFSKSDIISLHLPATEETRRSIGMEQFKKMKTAGWLINTSRGSILREDELYQALEQGVLAGAGLDVFEAEPPSPDNPLFSSDKVIITPHSAAMTEEAMDQMGIEAAMGIDDVLSGRKPAGLVNSPVHSIQ